MPSTLVPSGWHEVIASPLNPSYVETVTSVDTDSAHELLWAGTESGGVYALQCPTLKRFSSSRAHAERVDHIVSKRGGGAVSLSASALKLHRPGGLVDLTIKAEDAPLLACAFEPGGHETITLSKQGGSLVVHDLASGGIAAQAELDSDAVILRAPAGRGQLAVGTDDGQLLLLDPRTGYKVTGSVAAFGSGLAALDCKADVLVISGYTKRNGCAILDTHVKVFDVRMAPRVLTMLPFAAGPATLRFHPLFSSTVLVASASGAFTLADAQGISSYSQIFKVDMAGDMLTSAALASTGDAIAFGGSSGFVHLWALGHSPRLNADSEALQLPSSMPQPAVRLSEHDSFSLAAKPLPHEGKLLSDFDPTAPLKRGLPPHIIDPVLLTTARRADFVTYIQNPYLIKGAPQGTASAKVAALRNKRITVGATKADSKTAEEWTRQMEQTGRSGTTLPAAYCHTKSKQQAGTRFEAFDFSLYNKTRFAGLENDSPNGYANPLWQLLFFTPSIRNALLKHVPEANKEFCLTCELGFLFRMLYTAKGAACQATNLLRALRQSREACALGLLESQAPDSSAQGGAKASQGDQGLRRRIQSLSRFVMQQLHREATSSGTGPSSIEAVAGIQVRKHIACMSGKAAERTTDSTIFQVDLRPPSPAAGGNNGSKQGTAADDAALSDVQLPTFTQLLEDSMVDSRVTRGWFDAEQQYQQLQQSNVPLKFPQLMVISCGVPQESSLLWQATANSADIPWSLAIESNPSNRQVKVSEGTEKELLEVAQAAGGIAQQRAVYRLTAVLHHIHDADEDGRDSKAPKGHLTAHIRVPAQLVEETLGSAHRLTPPLPPGQPQPLHNAPPATSAASLSQSQTTSAQTGAQTQVNPDVSSVPGASADDADGITAMDTLTSGMQQTAGGASNDSRAATPAETDANDSHGPAANSARDAAANDHTASGATILADAAEAASPSSPDLPQLADGDAGKASHRDILDPQLQDAIAEQEGDKTEAGSAKDRAGAGGQPGNAAQQEHAHDALKQNMGALSLQPGRQSSFNPQAQSWQPQRKAQQPADRWLVFNDFVVSETSAHEVQATFGDQKLPCLLYYTRVEALKDAAAELQAPPPPLLMPAAFQQLCLAPPLQGPHSRVDWQTFTVPRDNEQPRPGMILGMDAEFVALSQPDQHLQGGGDVEGQVARLGLARVSIVRGEGLLAGQPCIDDYILIHEPIADYLTRFSGIVAADLDLAQSRKYLTTGKRSYMKLQYLVDSGVTLVGHGLKKDFRMINIVVPPSQVVDTAELFSFKRQRKLSLRFLAAFLLRIDIQSQAHDSIEDARTALALYKTYQRLQAAGPAAQKGALLCMYNFGQDFGWDPMLWPRPPPII